jgi:tRNA modification GTPase
VAGHFDDLRQKMGQEEPNRVVLLSPEGRGAVATLLVEGASAATVVGEYFFGRRSAPLDSRPLGNILHGRWGSSSGEDVVVCRRAETEVEIHCHGGSAAAQRIVADLTRSVCTQLSWREWVRRREPSAVRAEARILLADARTELAATILVDQYLGALDQQLTRIIRKLEAGDTQQGAAQLEALLRHAAVGLHLVEPWRVVLAGPPNVGKSSLINALVGYRRSIVFDEPGTTRDVVTVSTAIEGWPVELSDTAGLRASDDPLEAAGVLRAEQQVAAADCLVLVFDAGDGWTAELNLLAAERPAAVVVHNKSDLLKRPLEEPENRAYSSARIERTTASGRQFGADSSLSAGLHDRPPGLLTSAVTGHGIQRLAREIIGRLVACEPAPGDAVPFTASQVALLRAAHDEVGRGEIPAACRTLRQI